MRRCLLVVVLFALTLPAFARSSNDRVSFGRDITVAAGETADDIACAFCQVTVHGNVQGDVAVLFGRISVDPGQTISGDVAALGGDLTLGEGATVDGDVAIAAGGANLAPGAAVHGDQKVSPTRAWLLVPLAPLLILAGVIWLIVWVVQRARYAPRAYPPGRRF